MAYKYGNWMIGAAKGDQRLFDGADSRWEEQWEPTVPDAKATLWRYMSFAKLCDLLQRKRLFFPLVNKMNDKHEGFIYPPIPHERRRLLARAERDAHDMLEKLAKACLINCWTKSEHESSLMWNTYAGDEGVAVQTTFERLQTSMPPTVDHPVKIGMVSYLDYSQEEVQRFGCWPLFHKRMEYHEEGEVRAVLPPPPWEAALNPDVSIQLDRDVKKRNGRYIPVNLDNLVKEVVLPPHATLWFATVVKSVVRRSGVRARVSRSAIESPPHRRERQDAAAR